MARRLIMIAAGFVIFSGSLVAGYDYYWLNLEPKIEIRFPEFDGQSAESMELLKVQNWSLFTETTKSGYSCGMKAQDYDVGFWRSQREPSLNFSFKKAVWNTILNAENVEVSLLLDVDGTKVPIMGELTRLSKIGYFGSGTIRNDYWSDLVERFTETIPNSISITFVTGNEARWNINPSGFSSILREFVRCTKSWVATPG